MRACFSQATCPARLPASIFRWMAAGQCCEDLIMATTTADLIIRNGKVVSHDAVFPASVAIKDGRILAVGADDAMPLARESFDATGLHVLPGAIDVNVHF